VDADTRQSIVYRSIHGKIVRNHSTTSPFLLLIVLLISITIMQPSYPTNAFSDDSEGEEEVISTWKSSKGGAIYVVSPADESSGEQAIVGQTSAPQTSSTQTSSQSNARLDSPSNQQQAPTISTPLQSSPAQRQMKAAWYLGGNHSVRLLTSVSGDFDPLILEALASVPSAIGELALSVESLVSDDFTVGGFEDDILAKIAANTLAAKRASVPLDQAQAPAAPQVAAAPAAAPTAGSLSPTSFVPNPLAAYKPVPNPLARVTPPASPTYMTEDTTDPTMTGKRKEAPTTSIMPAAKMVRREVPASMIKAT
jgi:hypothetical protein